MSEVVGPLALSRSSVLGQPWTAPTRARGAWTGSAPRLVAGHGAAKVDKCELSVDKKEAGRAVNDSAGDANPLP